MENSCLLEYLTQKEMYQCQRFYLFSLLHSPPVVKLFISVQQMPIAWLQSLDIVSILLVSYKWWRWRRHPFIYLEVVKEISLILCLLSPFLLECCFKLKTTQKPEIISYWKKWENEKHSPCGIVLLLFFLMSNSCIVFSTQITTVLACLTF